MQTDQVKHNVTLIMAEEESRWVSCSKINKNLLESYHKIPATSVRVCSLYGNNKKSSDAVQEIISSKVDTIVFLDHQVRPIELLNNKKLQDFIRTNNVKVVFHIYGCFFDRLMEFNLISKLLRGQNVHFIASSPRHQALVESMMKHHNFKIHLVPFPIDTKKFIGHNQDLVRKNNNLSESDKVLVYIGRISSGKNVELTMRWLANVRRNQKNLKFFYIGGFDGFETSFRNNTFSNPSIINAKILDQIDPNNEWCFYRPHADEVEVCDYLSMADGYISLSTFRGEDFGMAVLEACASGLNCFLTDWGGYSGFSNLPGNHYAKVNVYENDVSIELEKLELAIEKLERLDSQEKETKRLITEKEFGIERTSLRLLEVLQAGKAEFEGIKNHPLMFSQTLQRPENSLDALLQVRGVYGKYWE